MGNTKGTRRSFGAIRRFRSGRYSAAYTGPDGAIHKASRTFEAKDDAAAWLSKERRLIEFDVWVPPALRDATGGADGGVLSLTFEAYADQWLKHRKLKESTRSLYRSKLDRWILPEFGAVELPAISPTDVRVWHSELLSKPVRSGGSEGRTGETRTAHAYSLLKSIMASAVDDGLVKENPCKIRGASQTKRTHEIVLLTIDELADLSAAMPDPLALLVTVSAWCGLRRGELLALRRRDISDDGAVIHVRRAVTFIRSKATIGTPKSDAGVRDVVVPPHIVPQVLAHLDAHVSQGRDSLLFADKSGGVLDEWSLRFHFKQAAASIGREDLRLHDLRHQGAVMAARAGATTRELMDRLGHTTPAMSMRYQHAAAGRDAEIAARMSKLAKGGSDE